MAVIALGGMVRAAVTSGQISVSWQQVGADALVSAAGASTSISPGGPGGGGRRARGAALVRRVRDGHGLDEAANLLVGSTGSKSVGGVGDRRPGAGVRGAGSGYAVASVPRPGCSRAAGGPAPAASSRSSPPPAWRPTSGADRGSSHSRARPCPSGGRDREQHPSRSQWRLVCDHPDLGSSRLIDEHHAEHHAARRRASTSSAASGRSAQAPAARSPPGPRHCRPRPAATVDAVGRRPSKRPRPPRRPARRRGAAGGAADRAGPDQGRRVARRDWHDRPSGQAPGHARRAAAG